MKFLTAIRHGFHRTHRSKGLVIIAWLASLVPALLLSSLFAADLGESLDRSLFAQSQYAHNGMGVWIDFTSSPASDLQPIQGAIGTRFLLVLLLQILVSAGIVEVLLGRTPRDQRPFFLGMGRHFWRFFRSAFWFLLAVGVLVALLAALMGRLTEHGADIRDGGFQLTGWIVTLLVGFLLFIPLKLAYDLSRVAAAAHHEGSTFKGFFRALAHVLRNPLALFPLYLVFALLALAVFVGSMALRDAWIPASMGAIFGMLIVQQLLLLFRAYLRVGLWGSEIAYYQAIGEPHWCAKKQKKKKTAEVNEEGETETMPLIPVTGQPSDPAPAEPPRRVLAEDLLPQAPSATLDERPLDGTAAPDPDERKT
ncbi:MAG: hypothetical protein AAF481_01535 [Acidobacteriota bacterium]